MENKKNDKYFREGFEKGVKRAYNIVNQMINESSEEDTLKQLRIKIDFVKESLDNLYNAAASGNGYFGTSAGRDWHSVVEYTKEVRKLLKKIFGRSTFIHK